MGPCTGVCGICGRTGTWEAHRVLAELLHVSQATYSRYESGGLDVPSGALIALAKFYGTSIDYLVGLSDDPRPHR